MYEIWLAINIVWEIILSAWQALAWVLGVGMLLLAAAWQRPAVLWRRALPFSLLTAAFAGVLGFLLIPASVHSSLQELGYWLDWVILGSLAAAAGMAAWAFAWPIGVLWRHYINKY